jgi:malate dehydrogenase
MKIAVLGATGSIGSPTSYYLAVQNLADEILMIGGKRQNVLQQLEMDIATAVYSQDVVVRAGDYEDLPGTDIIINTAAPHSKVVIKDRRDMLAPNITLVKDISLKIQQHCPDAIIINVNNPIEPLNYVSYLAGDFDRKKLIGYSANDSFRFRELLASDYGVKKSQVEGIVIGEHGSTQVLLFSSARIDGKPVLADQQTKDRIKGEIPQIFKKLEGLKAGRTAGYTCAVGIAEIVHAIKYDTGVMMPCSAVLKGEYGYEGLSMTVPAIIGKDGIREIQVWDIAPDEEAELKISTEAIQYSTKIVEESLGLTRD